MISTKIAFAALLCAPTLVACGKANDASQIHPSNLIITPPGLKIDDNVGFVEGRLISVGGLSGASNSPVQGTVTLTNIASGSVVDIPTVASGKFNAFVTPGIYNATGTTPQYVINGEEGVCSADKPLTVHAHASVSITVACSRK